MLPNNKTAVDYLNILLLTINALNKPKLKNDAKMVAFYIHVGFVLLGVSIC